MIVIAALLGVLVGSVLTVAAWRVPRDTGPASDTRAEGARDNGLLRDIPILHPSSWRTARDPATSHVAVRFPVLELATAALFGWMWVLFGWSWTLPAYLTLAAAAVLLTVIDLQHQRLPNAVMGPWAVAALALLLADAVARGTWESLLRALLGAAISFAVYLVLALISPSSLGMGDVKLAGVLGLYLGYLGWRTLILGAVGGFVIAALVGIVLLAMRRVTLRTQVPFGPPMLAAAIVAVALGAGAAA